jgi:hypothetical protein
MSETTRIPKVKIVYHTTAELAHLVSNYVLDHAEDGDEKAMYAASDLPELVEKLQADRDALLNNIETCRDAILYDVSLMEAGLNNDQINAVLDIFDDYFPARGKQAESH